MLEEKIQHLAKLYINREATPREIKEWAGELVQSGLHDENLIEAAYASEETFEDLRAPMDRFLSNLAPTGKASSVTHTKGVQEPIEFQPDVPFTPTGRGPLPKVTTTVPGVSARTDSQPIEENDSADLRKKPLGVIVLGVFSLLAGLAGASNLMYAFWTFQGFEILNEIAALMEDKNMAMVMILLYFAVGIGFLAGFTWSWWICSTHVSVIAVMGIYLLGTETPKDGSSWIVWFGILPSIFVLFYLFMPNVQMYFFQTMDLKLKKFRILLVLASIISALLISAILNDPDHGNESGEAPTQPST